MHKFRSRSCQVSELWEQAMQLPLGHLLWVSFRALALPERLLIQVWMLQKPRKRQLSCLWAGDPGSLAEMGYYWDKTAEKRSNSRRKTLPFFCRGTQQFIRVISSTHCSSTILALQKGCSWLCLGTLKCNALVQFADALVTTYSCQRSICQV